MSKTFNGTYSDLLAIAADDLRAGFAQVVGMDGAEALLRKVASNAVARFERPIDLLNQFPETLNYDFGSVSFEHGDTLGEAVRRLAESMICEETRYTMYECVWDSFENGAFETALECFETVVYLSTLGVGISDYEQKMALECLRALRDEGRVEQASWSVLRGGLNGARDLISNKSEADSANVIAEMGGIDTLVETARKLSKLTYLLYEDREQFHQRMAASWAGPEADDSAIAGPSL